jgi:CRP-like cAMP-binding protein
MNDLTKLLADQSFFRDITAKDLELLAGCASNTVFKAGDMLFQEGQAADTFFLIRYGRVGIEVFAPTAGPVTIQTLGEGEVVGWSWLFPPYRWQHDARALDLTRALAFDGACLRGKCDEDPRLGYELMKRFSRIIADRLNSARLQLLDVYGAPTHA